MGRPSDCRQFLKHGASSRRWSHVGIDAISGRTGSGWSRGAATARLAVGEGERMGMDARITDGAARTNGRRPGHVDMITDSERPAADPSLEPPTHRVAVVPRPRPADGAGAAGRRASHMVARRVSRTASPRTRPGSRSWRRGPAQRSPRGPRPIRAHDQRAASACPGGSPAAQSGRSAPRPAPDRAASRITSVPALRGDGPAPRVDAPAPRVAGPRTTRIPVVPPPRPAPPRPGPPRPAPGPAPPRPGPPRPAPAPPQPGPFRPVPAPPRAPSDATPRVPARNGRRDPASECVTSAIPVVARPGRRERSRSTPRLPGSRSSQRP